MDQRDDAAGHFHDFPKTAGDFDETSADRLAGDDSRRRDNVLRHLVRAIRDEPQPERALTAIVAALGLALDAAGGASLRHSADGPLHIAAGWGAKPPAAALSALSGLLREHTRSGDLIARFGGGEFVVWIERIDPAGARARAAALAAAVARLAPFAGAAEPAFGISIGVAPFDAARNETVMQLVLRAAADAARTNEQEGEPWPASLPA